MTPEQIIVNADKTLTVPDMPIIPFIEGDGTGPGIWKATVRVLNAAVEKTYAGKKKIEWLEILAGEKAYNETGSWLPKESLEAITKYRVALKGPLTTPVGGGIRSVNVQLRQDLDLYACVRPVKYIEPVPSPLKDPHGVDMIVFRENTEDVYMGLEWEAGSDMANQIIDLIEEKTNARIRPNSGIGIKPMSEFATKRLVHMAIEYALDNNRKSVTLIHKGNIMKFTERAFRTWGYEEAKEHFGNKIITEQDVWDIHNGVVPDGKMVIKDRIADAMFQQILLRPSEYDVLAMPNLNGDYMSDALAAMAGGLGLAPGANIGNSIAVFEATHGTAPKYANLDKINPGSLILSGAMMLDYLKWTKAAELVRQSLIQTIRAKQVTYDLARQIEGAVEVKCSEFATAMIDRM